MKLIKEYHKGITLLFNESKKHKQWIVSVSKALFGKRTRGGIFTKIFQLQVFGFCDWLSVWNS